MSGTFTPGYDALAAALILTLTPAILAIADEHEHEQHAAHVHGLGTLDVALDGQDLYVELRVPAMNIAGFEHAPATAAEHKAIDDARAALEDPARLFVTDAAAGCRAQEISVVFTAEHHADHADHDASHAERHDAEHEGEGHEAHHEEESHAEHHGGETHSEVEASYRFRCEAPERLRAIRVALFASFPGIEELETQVLGPHGQRRAELWANANELRLGR